MTIHSSLKTVALIVACLATTAVSQKPLRSESTSSHLKTNIHSFIKHVLFTRLSEDVYLGKQKKDSNAYKPKIDSIDIAWLDGDWYSSGIISFSYDDKDRVTEIDIYVGDGTVDGDYYNIYTYSYDDERNSVNEALVAVNCHEENGTLYNNEQRTTSEYFYNQNSICNSSMVFLSGMNSYHLHEQKLSAIDSVLYAKYELYDDNKWYVSDSAIARFQYSENDLNIYYCNPEDEGYATFFYEDTYSFFYNNNNQVDSIRFFETEDTEAPAFLKQTYTLAHSYENGRIASITKQYTDDPIYIQDKVDISYGQEELPECYFLTYSYKDESGSTASYEDRWTFHYSKSDDQITQNTIKPFERGTNHITAHFNNNTLTIVPSGNIRIQKVTLIDLKGRTTATFDTKGVASSANQSIHINCQNIPTMNIAKIQTANSSYVIPVQTTQIKR